MRTPLARLALRFLVVSAFGITAGVQAKTFDWAPDISYVPSLEAAVAGADRVARVHLMAREPVLEGRFGSPRCGYLYTAKVVDALKGGTKGFRFFAANDADFLSFAQDYFVFVYRVDPLRRARLIDMLSMTLSKDQFYRFSCQNFETSFVATFFQTMRAFAPVDGEGRERLAMPNREDVIGCEDADGKAGVMQRTPQGFLTVTDWDQVKRLVRQALAAPGKTVVC